MELNHQSFWLSAALFLALANTSASAAETPIFQLDPGGHMATINDIAFTADDQFLVSAGDDRLIRVWDINKGVTVRTLRGEIDQKGAGRIFAMALSADNQWLAAGGQTAPWTGSNYEDAAAIRLYNFPTGELVTRLKGHRKPVYALAFSPDNRYLLSGGADQSAIVWDIQQQTAVHFLIGHEAPIYAVAFSHDSKHLLTGSLDGGLFLWQTDNGKLVTRMEGHRDMISAIAISPQGIVATGSKDHSIRLWDSSDGKFIKLLAEQANEVGSLSFSPDGNYLLVTPGGGADTYPVTVYRTLDGKAVAEYAGHDNAVFASAISSAGANGPWAATGGGSQQEIHLWPLTGTAQEPGAVKVLAGIGSSIWTVGFSQDGRWLAWGKTQSGDPPPLEYEIRLPDNQDVLGVPQPITAGRSYLRAITEHGAWRLKPVIDDTGRVNALEVYEGDTVKARIEADKNSVRFRAFTFTPDGDLILVGGANGILSAYDLKGEKLTDFSGHSGDIWALAVSPDGKLLASASADQTIKLWDILIEKKGKTVSKLLLTLFHGADTQGYAPSRGFQRVEVAVPKASEVETIGEWIAWTASGYFSASANGDDYIGWHLNRGVDTAADYFPVARFAQQRYSPDIVSDTVRFRSESEAIARVNTSQGTKEYTQVAELLEKAPPAPRILQGPQGTVTTAEHELRVEHTDKLVISLNGRPIEQQRGFSRLQEPTQQVNTTTRTIKLKQGANQIDLLARNSIGDSPVVSLNVEFQPPASGTVPIPPRFKPRLFILAIGVSDYADDNLNLGFAAADAEAIAKRFQQEDVQGDSLYGEIHTKVLVDGEATGSEILGAMNFLERMTEDDIAILFIAGHGMRDARSNFYFLPHDFDQNNIRGTGVKWDEFYDVTSNLPGKVMLLADACNSGDIYGTQGRRAAVDMTQIAREFSGAGSGVIVFASSQGREYSEENPDWGHGAFTKSLIDGLAGAADFIPDGFIHQSELELYVKRGVVDLTAGRQHPVTIRPDAISDFVVARLRQ